MPVRNEKLDKLEQVLNKTKEKQVANSTTDYMNDEEFDVNGPVDFGSVKPSSALVDEDVYRIKASRFKAAPNKRELPMLTLNLEIQEGRDTGGTWQGFDLVSFNVINTKKALERLKDITVKFGVAEDFNPSHSNLIQLLEGIGEHLVDNELECWVAVRHSEYEGKMQANVAAWFAECPQ